MVEIKINNEVIKVPEGTTILQAANEMGIRIPTLCLLNLHDIKMVNQVGTCRVCMVEIAGMPSLMPACTTEVWDGLDIHTNSARAINARRTNTELLLSNHPKDCLVCERNLSCELQHLAAELGIHEDKYQGKRMESEKDNNSYSMVRNAEKCVLCRRCETMCNDVQTVGVYSTVHRGFETVMGTAFDYPILDTACTFCGQCVSVCPTGALTEINDVGEVWKAINDPDKYVVVQTAPAIRVALGESFGMPIGSQVTGKMVTALRRLGFDQVLDTDFAADLTVLEEASELLHRIENGGRLPMLTSCCPAWVKFIEHQFPELLDVPSTCKSPQQMFGTIAKTYLAEKLKIDPAKMVVVSVMPCLAKKFEARREELSGEGRGSDVDFVLSTRELAKMIKEAGLNFKALPDSNFDKMMGESSGAGVIFGTTGGVIEAVVRTVSAWKDGAPKDVAFTQLRGMDGIREAEVTVGGQKLKIGIAHGLGNARKLLEDIRDGKAQYHAIEIMACPSGCVGGGGQPYHGNDMDVLRERAKAIYKEDEGKSCRMAHENAELIQLYDEFLGEKYGKKAHDLLHTKFTKREQI